MIIFTKIEKDLTKDKILEVGHERLGVCQEPKLKDSGEEIVGLLFQKYFSATKGVWALANKETLKDFIEGYFFLFSKPFYYQKKKQLQNTAVGATMVHALCALPFPNHKTLK